MNFYIGGNEMKKKLKIPRNIFIGLVLIPLLLSGVMSIYHHIMLGIESKTIKNVGTLVDIDGHNMNIYIEGEIRKGQSTIVLLSGSGVAAPIYDYKILYSKLSKEYRIAVVEKFGYGYSDISGISRDVVTMVEENREALKKIDENGPYILMPHSMSALESIYWATRYPDEVKAIIGLDMAVPNSYDIENNNIFNIAVMKTMTFFGLHRIPAFCYVNEDGLSTDEIEQHKALVYRNSLNDDVYEECKVVYDNAETVQKLGVPDIPILMFTTNLDKAEGYEKWVNAQDKFAQQSEKYKQIKLNCGHNLHYYESNYITEQIKKFLK